MEHARKTARKGIRVMTPEEFTRGMSKKQLQQRLDDVRAKLRSRTDRDGNPKAGFKVNVAMLKVEIARLEGKLGAPAKP